MYQRTNCAVTEPISTSTHHDGPETSPLALSNIDVELSHQSTDLSCETNGEDRLEAEESVEGDSTATDEEIPATFRSVEPADTILFGEEESQGNAGKEEDGSVEDRDIRG